MNNEQRGLIRKMVSRLQDIRSDLTDLEDRVHNAPHISTELVEGLCKYEGELSELKDSVTQHADDEQEKYDNMSEGLQNADNGQAIEAAAENLTNAADHLEEAVDVFSPVETMQRESLSDFEDHVSEVANSIEAAIGYLEEAIV